MDKTTFPVLHRLHIFLSRTALVYLQEKCTLKAAKLGLTHNSNDSSSHSWVSAIDNIQHLRVSLWALPATESLLTVVVSVIREVILEIAWFSWLRPLKIITRTWRNIWNGGILRVGKGVILLGTGCCTQTNWSFQMIFTVILVIVYCSSMTWRNHWA